MSTAIGLDIGTSHIKTVEIDKQNKEATLTRYAIVPQKKFFSDVGFWELDDIKLAGKTLKNFFEDYKFTSDKVISVIPESLTFSKVLYMPVLKDKELAEAISIEAKQHVPYPIDDLYLKYETLSTHYDPQTSTKQMKVLIVAVRKRNVDRYLRIIESAGKTPVGIEPSSVSTVRALIRDEAFDSPTLILNLGYKNTEFYYVVDRKFVYARSIGFGILSIIKAVSANLNISITKAIQYLYAYGLRGDVLDGNLLEIIKPGVNVLGSELEKSERYIASRDVFKSKDGLNQVKNIVFTGGGALIPELLGFMPSFTNAEISLANSWRSVNISKVSNVGDLDRASPLFSASVGAALK